jgi:Flp pilus assembly protein TadD
MDDRPIPRLNQSAAPLRSTRRGHSDLGRVSSAEKFDISRAHFCNSARRVCLRYGVCLVMSVWLACGCTAWAATCAPPSSMKKGLQGQPTVEAYEELGIYLGEQKQYECAAKAFSAALEIQPESGHVAFMLGLSLYSEGKGQEAIAPLQQAERLGFSDINLHLVLGAAFDQLQQIANAETEWRAALAIDPESTESLDSLSSDLVLDNDYPGTIALLENPMISGQRTPVQSLNLGLAYARTARLDESANALREGVNTSPDSLVLADELAAVLGLQTRYDEAATVLELAVERHPGDTNTEVLYLRTLMATKSEKTALVARKLLLTSPHNWEVLYLNGVLETKDGRLEQARAHLEQSVALKPDSAMSHDLLGLVLAQLNDMRGAKDHLQKAIALGDTSADVLQNLAKVLQILSQGK